MNGINLGMAFTIISSFVWLILFPATLVWFIFSEKDNYTKSDKK